MGKLYSIVQVPFEEDAIVHFTLLQILKHHDQATCLAHKLHACEVHLKFKFTFTEGHTQTTHWTAQPYTDTKQIHHRRSRLVYFTTVQCTWLHFPLLQFRQQQTLQEEHHRLQMMHLSPPATRKEPQFL